MKKIVSFFLILLFIACFHAKAQTTILSDSFDDITLLPGLGWVETNMSTPIGSLGYFQGNVTVVASYATSVYLAVNFNSVSGASTISNWKITPQLTLNNGDVIKFWSRTADASTWPDRLQFRLNTLGTTNVGADANSVGDFATLLLDINPTLTVGGYPVVWTEYTITLTGLTGPTTCRLAFRYYVTNGGPSGSNSNYVGIDEFTVTRPAAPACVVCPAGAIIETESCGNHTNDGYDYTGALFESLTMNSDICGTTYATSTVDKDFDWYTFTVSTPERYKFTLFADNDMHFQLIDITTTQNPIQLSTATACDTTTMELCLLPGIYAIRLTSVNTTGISCVGNNGYILNGIIVPTPQFLTAGSNSPVCAGDTLYLWADGGIDYEWMGPNGFSSNMSNPYIPDPQIVNTGNYSVGAIDINNCINVTNFEVNILDCTSIEENNSLSFLLYPNPAKESITIQTKQILNGQYTLQILNEQGQLVKNTTITLGYQSQFTIELGLPSGVYSVRLIDEKANRSGTQTFIIK